MTNYNNCKKRRDSDCTGHTPCRDFVSKQTAMKRVTMRRKGEIVTAPGDEGWSARIHTSGPPSKPIFWSLALKNCNQVGLCDMSLSEHHQGNSLSWEARVRSLEMSVMRTLRIFQTLAEDSQRSFFWCERKLVEINFNHWGGNLKRGQIVGGIGLGRTSPIHGWGDWIREEGNSTPCIYRWSPP